MTTKHPSGTVADVATFVGLIDHTLLKAEATPDAVARVADECVEFGFKACCVNPWHLPVVARRLEGAVTLPITVVGFPLGANLTATKVYETEKAVQQGAREIDMVINVGAFLGGQETIVRDDISAVVRAAGKIPVKVIIETCYLNTPQIQTITKLCIDTGAAFVKTSTGFGSRGASLEDIHAIKEVAKDHILIKASGGIKTLGSLLALVEAGANRVGSSASVALLREFQASLRS